MWPRVPRSPRARGRSSARPRRPLLVSPQLPPNVPRSEHRTACRCRRPHLTRGSPGPCPRPGCPTFSDIWKRLPWATRGGAGADPEGPGWGRGAFPRGMASSAGARWGGRTRAAAGCSRAWHRLGGAARAPQTGRRGAGAPSAGDAGGLSPRGVEAGGPGWLPRGDLRAAMRVRVCLRGADAARSGNGACAYGGPGTPSGPRPPSRSSPPLLPRLGAAALQWPCPWDA